MKTNDRVFADCDKGRVKYKSRWIGIRTETGSESFYQERAERKGQEEGLERKEEDHEVEKHIDIISELQSAIGRNLSRGERSKKQESSIKHQRHQEKQQKKAKQRKHIPDNLTKEINAQEVDSRTRGEYSAKVKRDEKQNSSSGDLAHA